MKARVCSATSGIQSSYKGHLRNLKEVWQAIRTLLKVRLEPKCPCLIATVILGFLSIFKKSHGSSAFEALNSA